MAGSRRKIAEYYGKRRSRDWFNHPTESRIKWTYEALGGLKVDPEDEHFLAEHFWHVSQQGYVCGPKSLRLHRLICDAKPGQVVDHINGNQLDNRKSNLRICTQAENVCNNRRLRKGKSSHLFKGVHLSRSGRWVAQIQKNGKIYHLGTFDSEFDAARAYDKKAKELHGEFASLNFPAGQDDLVACID